MAGMQNIHVAIIGAGVSGTVLALAMKQRGISYSLYDQAPDFSKYNLGFNFNPSGVRALQVASHQAYKAFQNVKVAHHVSRDDFYFAYSDGSKEFEVLSNDDFGSISYTVWFEEIAKILPTESIHFSKKVANIDTSGEKVSIKFEDGTDTSADVVVGCDGVDSGVRKYVVGDHPSAVSSFSHHVTYRNLVSRDDLGKVIGEKLAESVHFRCGDGVGYVSYPFPKRNVNRVGIFTYHEGQWASSPPGSILWSKDKLHGQVSDPFFKKVIDLLPDEVDVWAIYDTADNPLPTYSKGSIALVGDAAHASTTNLGAAASLAIEDVAIIAELLKDLDDERTPTAAHIEKALQAYSQTTKERTQWVVKASRELGNANLKMPLDDKSWAFDTYQQETLSRFHKVWDLQIKDAINNAKKLA